MDRYSRFAIYYAPRPGDFADRASALLAGALPGLPVEAPRRYGFHGTLKPPFRLAAGQTPDALHLAVDLLAHQLAPVTLPGLRLDRLGGFLALVPEGDTAALSALAARVVAELDPFRAAPTAAEIARRRPERLTDTQRALLDRWGYPWVMEEFRFHLTLSDAMPPEQAEALRPAVADHLDPLPAPFDVRDLCLFGEAEDGFRLLHRYALSG